MINRVQIYDIMFYYICCNNIYEKSSKLYQVSDSNMCARTRYHKFVLEWIARAVFELIPWSHLGPDTLRVCHIGPRTCPVVSSRSRYSQSVSYRSSNLFCGLIQIPVLSNLNFWAQNLINNFIYIQITIVFIVSLFSKY